MKTTFAFLLAVPLFLGACANDIRGQGPSSEQEVAAAFARYQDAVLRTDSDATSALFEFNASLGHNDSQPIVGRRKIRSLLETFAGYKLVPYDVDIKSTRMQGNAVVQTGEYRQVMTTPAGETLYVHGAFRATWVRQTTGEWLIESMRTASS